MEFGVWGFGRGVEGVGCRAEGVGRHGPARGFRVRASCIVYRVSSFVFGISNFGLRLTTCGQAQSRAPHGVPRRAQPQPRGGPLASGPSVLRRARVTGRSRGGPGGGLEWLQRREGARDWGRRGARGRCARKSARGGGLARANAESPAV